MKRIVTALAVLGFATAAFADPAATYAKKCAACHGKAGEGAKMAPEPIAGMPVAKVKESFKGVGKMKAVQVEEADAVAAYVAGLKK